MENTGASPGQELTRSFTPEFRIFKFPVDITIKTNYSVEWSLYDLPQVGYNFSILENCNSDVDDHVVFYRHSVHHYFEMYRKANQEMNGLRTLKSILLNEKPDILFMGLGVHNTQGWINESMFVWMANQYLELLHVHKFSGHVVYKIPLHVCPDEHGLRPFPAYKQFSDKYRTLNSFDRCIINNARLNRQKDLIKELLKKHSKRKDIKYTLHVIDTGTFSTRRCDRYVDNIHIYPGKLKRGHLFEYPRLVSNEFLLLFMNQLCNSRLKRNMDNS